MSKVLTAHRCVCRFVANIFQVYFMSVKLQYDFLFRLPLCVCESACKSRALLPRRLVSQVILIKMTFTPFIRSVTRICQFAIFSVRIFLLSEMKKKSYQKQWRSAADDNVTVTEWVREERERVTKRAPRKI